MKVGVWDSKADEGVLYDEWPPVASNGFTGVISSTGLI